MFPWRVRLAQRIVLSVALGLAFVLGLMSVLALWTVQQAIHAEYRTRLAVARTLAAETDSMVQVDEDMVQQLLLRLGSVRASVLSPAQLEQLRLALAPEGNFSTLELIDRSGVVRWWGSVYPLGGPPAWSDLAIVQQAWAKSAGVAGECPDDQRVGRPALCLAMVDLSTFAPETLVVGEVDERNGVLSLVPALAGGTGADVQVINASGAVVVRSGPSNPVMDAEHATLLRKFIAAGRAGVRIHQPGPGEVFSPHLVVYAPLQLVPGWGIVMEVPQDEVLAVPRQLALRLALFILGAEILAAVLAWIDVHHVVRPLRELTAAAERFAAGNLEMPVTLDRRDELGVLASTFESMRSQLKASLEEVERGRQELEQRVEERTAQIEEQNRRLAAMNVQTAELNAVLQQRIAERAALLSRVLNAQEGERERIARDLHDSTGQSLAAVLFSLELLEDALPESLAPLRSRVNRSREMTAAALAELRSLIAGLRPPALDDLGLVSALQAFARQWLEEQGITVHFTVLLLPERLSPPVEIAIFRIVQEALTNCGKHAQAHRVAVELRVEQGWLHVRVTDDGRGFDAAGVQADALHGAHVGLLGMRERAELLGGTLELHSVPGGGTTVAVRVPLEHQGEVRRG